MAGSTQLPTRGQLANSVALQSGANSLQVGQRCRVQHGGIAFDSRIAHPPFVGVIPMKSRWIVVSLVCRRCCSRSSGLTAAKEESAKKEFKATCPVSGKPAGEESCRRTEERRQGLLLLRELPEGVQEESRRSSTLQGPPPTARNRPDRASRLPDHRQAGEQGSTRSKSATTKVGFCCENCLKRSTTKADDEGKLKLAVRQALSKRASRVKRSAQ